MYAIADTEVAEAGLGNQSLNRRLAAQPGRAAHTSRRYPLSTEMPATGHGVARRLSLTQ